MTTVAAATLTIPAGTVSGTLSRFPMRIDLADLPVPMWGAIDTHGAGALRAYQSGAGVPLDVVDADLATRQGEGFVLIDLDGGSSTEITLAVLEGEVEFPTSHALGRDSVWADYDFFLHGSTDRTGKTTPTFAGNVTPLTSGGFDFSNGEVELSPLPRRTQYTVGATALPVSNSANGGITTIFPVENGYRSSRATLLLSPNTGYYAMWNSSNGYLRDETSPSSGAVGIKRRFHMLQDNALSQRSIASVGVVRNTGYSAVRPSGTGNVRVVVGRVDGSEPFFGTLSAVYLRDGVLSAEWLAAEQASWEESGFYTVSLAPDPEPAPSFVTYYTEGGAREEVLVSGYWDGTEVQPVTLRGLWDGSGIVSLDTQESG